MIVSVPAPFVGAITTTSGFVKDGVGTEVPLRLIVKGTEIVLTFSPILSYVYSALTTSPESLSVTVSAFH